MPQTVTVDTSAFNSMCRELAASAKAPPGEVMLAEIGKTLEAAARNTDVASATKIRNSASEYVAAGQDTYSPKRARRYGNLSINGYLFYKMKGNRYPNALWGALVSRRAASRRRKLAARGLAKRSWLQLADELGVSIKVPGYVAKAIATTGRTYADNAAVQHSRQAGRLEITIKNSQPTVTAIGGARALQAAIDGRVKYFTVSMTKGVFDDIGKIARRYPGIRVTA